MLKIKDNVDLKELEELIKKNRYKNFGIWKRYDIYTGKLENVYIGNQFKNGVHSSVMTYDNGDRIIICTTTFHLDFLYDLIKADLVEKVDE